MDRKYIDDNHVVARYLADQLSDTDREAFEAFYVANPDVLSDMEAAARLKLGLAELARSGELDSLLRDKPWYSQPRYLAAAAAIAAVAFGAFVYLRSPSMQPMLAGSANVFQTWRGAVLPIAQTHVVLRTRSISYDAEIELPSSPGAIELRVLPEYEAQPPRYRVTLHAIADDDSLQSVADIGALTPDSEGFVPVFINSSKIAPGRYQLTLAGDEGTSAASDESSFLIRFRAAGGAQREL